MRKGFYGSDLKIDTVVKNETHVRFLEGRLAVLQQEAQRIVEAKVPRWW